LSDSTERLDLVRSGWDAYHSDYMGFNLKEWPLFYEHFASGRVMLDEGVTDLAGDVTGLRLLDICCAGDAKQAFSWANLGAEVTACDISPIAIEIAQKNAERIGLPVTFYVADAQTLDPIADESQDLVFATYLMWFEDISLALRNWHRVLRPGGRLLIDTYHPVTDCLDEVDGRIVPGRFYHDTKPEFYEFDGTPLAHRNGGWDRSVPIVEFHHTLSDIMNAAVEAGFRLAKVEEPYLSGVDGGLAKLPFSFRSLWQK
jgi:ubiquinone/menaquinone biosynthesis C-methylase UbiE